MTIFPVYTAPVTRFSGHSSTNSSSKPSKQSPQTYEDNDVLIFYGAPIPKITYETPEKTGQAKRFIPYPPLPQPRTASPDESVHTDTPDDASATISTEPLGLQPKRPEMQEIKRNSPFSITGEHLWIGGAPIPRVKPAPHSKHVHFQLDEPETDSPSDNSPHLARHTQFHWSRFQETDSESEQSDRPTRFLNLLGARIPERKRFS